MRIQLMTDGGADLPARLTETLDIIIVPLYLHFKDQQYISGVTLSLQEFYQKVKVSDELPRSSAPSPNDFYEAYKKVDPATPIINLSLTKGLSSTYENAVAAKEMLLEEEPARQIAVINTKTATCGLALFLYEANDKIRQGYTFDQLTAHLTQCSEKVITLVALKTLDNVIKGGRLDKVRGAIAKTLNIKVLMRNSEEGALEVAEKVRGDKKTIRRLIEQIGEYTKDFEEKTIVMSHSNAESRAKGILEDIMNRYKFKDSYLMDMGPLISTYAGEGGIVLSFYK
ncbi:fatty acid-binding protein DegV [Virgibacillus phasianinus]|uniref:Fatty acid-binding protein DegV n=1 Tax=Virgibacillus phasianinus TaxID=2017483 RepID=A0A220U038_9BACI|nr:DegV family protein [Virgibacillus phasianinus]ASK61261.1 fatty acid-binding protein DegV [Virgibacillus phasianinus]